MGKLEVFEVVFDGDVDVFRPGESIQGHVRIVLSEPTSGIRGNIICIDACLSLATILYFRGVLIELYLRNEKAEFHTVIQFAFAKAPNHGNNA